MCPTAESYPTGELMATKSNKQGAKKGAAKSGRKGGPAKKGAATKSAGKSAAKAAAEKLAALRGAPPPRVLQEPESPMPAQHLKKPGIEADLELQPRYEAPHYRAAGKLEGRTALITGGDSGIGRAVAVLFAREGADVALVYLPEEQVDAEETRRAVESEGRRALLIPGDVRESSFCQEAVGRTVERFDRTFRTNIYGYFYMAKAALGHMDEGACIINTGSITGLEGSKELLDYSATKGAIHAFTKSLAQNLVERRIRVNCVAPGPVWTPLNPADKEAKDVPEFGADTPFKRPAQPEEMAPAYVFFASEADSSYITGEVLSLLGGDTTAG